MDKDDVIRILNRMSDRFASLYCEVQDASHDEDDEDCRDCAIKDALERLAYYYERWYDEYHIDNL